MDSIYVRDSEGAAEAHHVSHTRTTNGEFVAALAGAVRELVVDAPLSFDDTTIGRHVTFDPALHQLRETETGNAPPGSDVGDYGTAIGRSNEEGDESVSLPLSRHIVLLLEGL